MGALNTSVQREMLNCTYPALYVVMFAIMEVSSNHQSKILNWSNNLICLSVLGQYQGEDLGGPADEDCPHHQGESPVSGGHHQGQFMSCQASIIHSLMNEID